jgi:hypothetical protein
MSPHLPRARRLATCLLLVAFVALALACGSTSLKPKAVGTVKVNEELVFNDSTWVVLEARDLGKVLKSTDPDEQDKKADGRFILVRYKVTNTGKKTVWLGDDPPLLDDKERQFETLGDAQAHYLPKGAKTLGEADSDQIPAGITREFHAIYEVPTDARGLRLKGESFAEGRRRQQEGFILLGL